MVGVVVFGYFYTVRPAFQLQVLQEQTAELQLANESAKQQLARTKVAQNIAEAKLAETNQKLIQIHHERDELAESLSRENALATETIKRLGKQTEAQSESLVSAQRQLLDVAFSLRLGVAALRRAGWPSSSTDDDGKFILSAREHWPDPFATFSETLLQLESINSREHTYPPDLLIKLRELLDSKRLDLTCDTVDLEKLRQDYLSDLKTSDAEVEKEETEYEDKLIREGAERHQKVLITDTFKATNRNVIRIGKVYSIHVKYSGEIDALKKACESKSEAVEAFMRQLILPHH
jgi:hypothetical protein